MQWDKIQRKIFQEIYTKKTIENKLQTDNAFLDETHYHYLISSLGLTLENNVYLDHQGQGIKRDQIKFNLDYLGDYNLEELSLSEAVQDCSFIAFLKANDDKEEYYITVTYNTDTIVRAFCGETKIPPLLLGYEFLVGFMSNQNIAGYIRCNADLTALGLVFNTGIMGSILHEKDLRKILNGE